MTATRTDEHEVPSFDMSPEAMKQREDIWSALYNTRVIKWKKRLKPENRIARATATAFSLLQDDEQKIQEMRIHNDFMVAMKLIYEGYRYEAVYLALKAVSPIVREKPLESRHEYLASVLSQAAVKVLEDVDLSLCLGIVFKDDPDEVFGEVQEVYGDEAEF